MSQLTISKGSAQGQTMAFNPVLFNVFRYMAQITVDKNYVTHYLVSIGHAFFYTHKKYTLL